MNERPTIEVRLILCHSELDYPILMPLKMRTLRPSSVFDRLD